ncbi:EamA family transporter, partial [Rhizobium sp. TRM95111]|uniref:EamA family transporter n=1 Tax=Rhizobium alarense TaxID=2846851 RepID=UPI001F421277
MSFAVVALALFAAILHATWNAFLRNGADRLWAVTVMSFTTTFAAVPLAILSPAPDVSAWIFIGLSAVLQVGYSVFLVEAYRHGELGQVYPVVRGVVPLLVTLGGLLFAGETIAPVQVIGIVLVAAGIMSLALGRGRTASVALLFALATGMIIASYVTVDAVGVRRAG